MAINNFKFDDTNILVKAGNATLHNGVMLVKDFCDNPDRLFDTLLNKLNFEHRENSPRRELYFNDLDVPYTYGNPIEGKTFEPQPWDADVLAVRDKLAWLLGCPFEVCFVNCYDHHRHHLGWHADDSPEMDDGRPIVTVSLGAEREIWFRPNGGGNEDVVKVSLPNGSACIMPPGYQDTHQHRIPKHSAECGPRISLTFRGYTSDGQ